MKIKPTYNSFALGQLKKFGWSEGDGIGKSNSGRIEPVKAVRKFTTAGLGFNHAKEFETSKWTDMYAEASSRVCITNDNVITTETSTVNTNDRKRVYSSFEKGAMLTGGVETSLDVLDEAEDSTTKKLKKKRKKEKKKKRKEERKRVASTSGAGLSDAELFAFCEGRTCHPASRFGIKLSGKLGRVERHNEQLRLAKLTAEHADDHSTS